jgi:hypothetical protein
MNRKWISTFAAAAIGAGLFATSAFAYGEGGHGHHRHRDSAMGLCVGVMTPEQRASLRTTVGSSWETLKADSAAVHSAKAAITHDILYGNSVTADEATLATAAGKLQSDKDSMAAQVCKNVKNITAVQTLYGQMEGLHQQAQTLHQNAYADLKTAQNAQ